MMQGGKLETEKVYEIIDNNTGKKEHILLFWKLMLLGFAASCIVFMSILLTI